MEIAHQNVPGQILIATGLLSFFAGALFAWSAMIPAPENADDIGSQEAGMVFSLAIVTFTALGLVAPRLPVAFRGLRGGASGAVYILALKTAGATHNPKLFTAKNAFIVKPGNEGTTVAKICRKAGISQVTYFNWKKLYEGLMPSKMRRLG